MFPGQEQLFKCAPTRHDQLPPGAMQRPYLYFMLHGLDSDGSRFWGDDPGHGGTIEAVNTANLPKHGLGVALAGCCWGALTVDQRAKDRSGILSPKTPERSMALSTFCGRRRGVRRLHRRALFTGRKRRLLRWPDATCILAAAPRNRRPPGRGTVRSAARTSWPTCRTGGGLPLEIGIERKIYKHVHLPRPGLVAGPTKETSNGEDSPNCR